MRDSTPPKTRSVVAAVAASVTVVLLCLTTRLATAELRAGVSTADITPPVGGRMYGYGARGTNVSVGVHDKLHAKALVLSDGTTHLAIVSLDLGSITAPNTAAMRKMVRTETPIEHILLVASHTHSSPRFAPDFPSEEKETLGLLTYVMGHAGAGDADARDTAGSIAALTARLDVLQQPPWPERFAAQELGA